MYLLKQEISTSLAWALTFTSEGNFVLTPGTEEAFYQNDINLPPNKMVLRGRTFSGLTTRQEEIARLAIIFSIGRRDLADELRISINGAKGGQWLDTVWVRRDFLRGFRSRSILQDDSCYPLPIEEIVERVRRSKRHAMWKPWLFTDNDAYYRGLAKN
jgi:hypothetical protein